MTFLDSDHFSLLRHTEGGAGERLAERLAPLGEDVAVPIVVLEESCRGWLAEIARAKDEEEKLVAYAELSRFALNLRTWRIVDYDSSASRRFANLRAAKIRIGSSDLRIAAIALAHGALLLTANLRDFRKVPGLRAESWI